MKQLDQNWKLDGGLSQACQRPGGAGENLGKDWEEKNLVVTKMVDEERVTSNECPKYAKVNLRDRAVQGISPFGRNDSAMKGISPFG